MPASPFAPQIAESIDLCRMISQNVLTIRKTFKGLRFLVPGLLVCSLVVTLATIFESEVQGQGQTPKPAVKKSDATARELTQAMLMAEAYLAGQVRENGSYVAARRLKDARDLKSVDPEAELVLLRALIRMQGRRADFMRTAQIEQSLQFWEKQLKPIGGEGKLALLPDGQDQGLTVRHALLILVYSDLMEIRDQLGKTRSAEVAKILDQMLAFLLSIRRDDGHFYSTFDAKGMPGKKNHPDADGQALNALTRETIRRGEAGEKYRQATTNSAFAMYQAYFRDAVRDGALVQLVTVYAVHSLEAYVLLASVEWKQGDFSMTEPYRKTRTSEVASWALKTVTSFGGRGRKAIQPNGESELGHAALDMLTLAWCWRFAFMVRDVKMRDQLRSYISPRMDDLMRRQIGNPMQAAYIGRLPVAPDLKGAMIEGRDMPVVRLRPLASFLLAMRVANDFGYGK